MHIMRHHLPFLIENSFQRYIRGYVEFVVLEAFQTIGKHSHCVRARTDGQIDLNHRPSFSCRQAGGRQVVHLYEDQTDQCWSREPSLAFFLYHSSNNIKVCEISLKNSTQVSREKIFNTNILWARGMWEEKFPEGRPGGKADHFDVMGWTLTWRGGGTEACGLTSVGHHFPCSGPDHIGKILCQ